MKGAGREGTTRMVKDRGYRIPFIFIKYAQSMREQELIKYEAKLKYCDPLLDEKAEMMKRCYPDYIAWLKLKIAEHKALQLIGAIK